MNSRVFAALIAACVAIGSIWAIAAPARAQSLAWIQVEAQPDIRSARQRARVYARNFPGVRAFRTPTGWYAITLAPMDPDRAARRLENLKARGAIPRDAFIVEDGLLLAQIWPADVNAGLSAPAVAAAMGSGQDGGGLTISGAEDDGADTADDAPEGADRTTTAALSAEEPEETPAQARALERRLSRDKKMAIQTALVWTGHYESRIDGDFGSGTRRAIKAYQESIGHAPTGYLTTRQMERLLNGYQTTMARLGFRTVTDDVAGIELPMPTALVRFSHYDPPFVHYESRPGSRIRVLLISEEGDRRALSGLYDIMETLEIVPLEGYRVKKRDWFVLSGRDDKIVSYTYARLDNGEIKGFTLIWPPEADDVMKRVATAMYNGFKPIPGIVLDPALGASAEQRVDLVSGLQVRKPASSGSGFFVDQRGDVATSAEIISNCARVTIEDDQPMDVVWTDPQLGIAVLRPQQEVAPLGWARIATEPPRLRSRVVVSGYSYFGRLGAPTQSYGRIEDLRDLDDNPDRARLSIQVQPGDAGGPVLDDSGAVIGMLLPDREGARKLPQDVHFALSADVLAQALTEAGVPMALATDPMSVAAEDLVMQSSDMTVLVSCWK